MTDPLDGNEHSEACIDRMYRAAGVTAGDAGLREAAEALLAVWDEPRYDTAEAHVSALALMMPVLRAALAAPPPPRIDPTDYYDGMDGIAVADEASDAGSRR